MPLLSLRWWRLKCRASAGTRCCSTARPFQRCSLWKVTSEVVHYFLAIRRPGCRGMIRLSSWISILLRIISGWWRDNLVGAVVLAAGSSRRMGQPKMLLKWGDTTVIAAIVQKVVAAQIQPICVVVGAGRMAIAEVLYEQPAQLVFNSRFQEDSRVLSLQAGLACLPDDIQAALGVLGDPPHAPGQMSP